MENNFYKYFNSLKGALSEKEKEFINKNVPKKDNEFKGTITEEEMNWLKKMAPNN